MQWLLPGMQGLLVFRVTAFGLYGNFVSGFWGTFWGFRTAIFFRVDDREESFFIGRAEGGGGGSLQRELKIAWGSKVYTQTWGF